MRQWQIHIRAAFFQLFVFTGSLFFAHTVGAGEESGDTRSYAIVIGNNAPPATQHNRLSTLKYADDDVIRMYQFFRRFGSEVHLLTVADSASQRRYPEIASLAKLPDMENLLNSVGSIERRIAQDRANGRKPVVYLYFSGHGTHDAQGIPGLVLMDANLTRETLYREIIDALDAEYFHVFIDACYAEGVVGSRGLFDNEESARTVALSSEEQRAAKTPVPDDYPELGIFVSSSANRQSHEWSRLESGVFTHVVLSGLSGLADINGDGQIAYSELYAFSAAANRSVKKSLAQINVVVAPPGRNLNVPIADISRVKNVAYIFGDFSSQGHFYLESDDGVRFLDGHVQGIQHSRFWVPANQRLYIHSRQKEALVYLAPNQAQSIDNLSFRPRENRSKGAIESALAEGLFKSSYGPEYYRGVVDSSRLISVTFPKTASSKTASPDKDSTILRNSRLSDPSFPNIRKRQKMSVATLALATVFSGASATFAVLHFRFKEEYLSPQYKTPTSDEYNDKQRIYGTMAWISGGMAVLGIVTGALLWPRKSDPENRHKTVAIGTDFHGAMQFRFTSDF